MKLKPFYFLIVAVLTSQGGVALYGAIAAPGAESPPAQEQTTSEARSAASLEKILNDKGLTRDNRKFVLDELHVLEAYGQARTLYAEYEKAMYRQVGIAQFDENLATIEQQVVLLQQEANGLQYQINTQAAAGARMRLNMNVQLSTMRQTHAAAVNQVNQLRAQSANLHRNAPKPDARKTAVLELEKASQAYSHAAQNLAGEVNSLMEKYAALAHDKVVINAIAQLRHETTRNYVLGPSDELREATKVLKELKLLPKQPAKRPHSAVKTGKSV